MRTHHVQESETGHHESRKATESSEIESTSYMSRFQELEEEISALKQSNKHLTIELEKAIKVAKEFESRSHEDQVRYDDASQALTNWKRTAQELGQQVLFEHEILTRLIFCN
jgi:predicted RNase H-like nuclease (RuvC/YqgF family)